MRRSFVFRRVIRLFQCILRFKVYDPAAEVAVNLYSKSVKVALTGDLIRTFDDYSLRYTLM